MRSHFNAGELIFREGDPANRFYLLENGRVELFNPAFVKTWKLSAEVLREQPHIETVEAWCKPLFDDAPTWRALREAITGIENRAQVALKLERKDGSVLDCMTMPLPDGAIPDSAKASFTNGVLEVSIEAPPRDVSRGRKIEIA